MNLNRAKGLAFVLGSVILMCGCWGCNHTQTSPTCCYFEGYGPDSSRRMPEALVGEWSLETKRWSFDIQPDGGITNIVRSALKTSVKFEPGKDITLADEGTSKFRVYFLWGPCQAMYEPESRGVEIKLYIDIYRLTGPTFKTVEGTMVDTITGVLSEDGTKIYAHLVTEGTAGHLGAGESKPRQMIFYKKLE